MQICTKFPGSKITHEMELSIHKKSKQKSIKKTQKHKNSNRVGCPIKTFLLSNVASNFLSPCFPHFSLFQMHFLPTSSPPKMHFPSDHKSLHNCQIRLRQLTRREHKAVLRPSNQEIDTQLYSPLQLIYSSLKLIYHAALLSSAVDLLPFKADLPCSSTLLCS